MYPKLTSLVTRDNGHHTMLVQPTFGKLRQDMSLGTYNLALFGLEIIRDTKDLLCNPSELKYRGFTDT